VGRRAAGRQLCGGCVAAPSCCCCCRLIPPCPGFQGCQCCGLPGHIIEHVGAAAGRSGCAYNDTQTPQHSLPPQPMQAWHWASASSMVTPLPTRSPDSCRAAPRRRERQQQQLRHHPQDQAANVSLLLVVLPFSSFRRFLLFVEPSGLVLRCKQPLCSTNSL
jgi:hypothetical protein